MKKLNIILALSLSLFSYNANANGFLPGKDGILSSKTKSPNTNLLFDSNGNIDPNLLSNINTIPFKASYPNSVARTIQDKLSDKYNLADLGAKLDNSSSDKNTIQNIYNNLPSGSTVEVPYYSTWDGIINNPDPNKHISWILDGAQGGYYAPPVGDGDISITSNSGVGVNMRMFNSKSFQYPFTGFFWQDDPNFCGAWCNNWQQQASLYGRAIHGPQGSGNVSSLQLSLDSYGNAPSGVYDVVASMNGTKLGQNSMWGIVDDLTDLSAKAPGAFAQWNEYDMWGNGYDTFPWALNYGETHAGNRSTFFVGLSDMYSNSQYRTNTAYGYTSNDQGNLPHPTVVATTATDNQTYVWRTVKGGISGSSGPIWPAPTKARVTYSQGSSTIKVTYILSGKINIGDYITGSQPVGQMQITGQIDGTTGGVGTYSVSNNTESSFTENPVFIAPHVVDGTVEWELGTNYQMTVGSILYVTGPSDSTVETVVGGETNVSNAVFDSSRFKLSGDAASLRMADGQTIDFTGNGQPSERNKHLLFHTYQWGNVLAYQINKQTAFYINDDFSSAGFNMLLNTNGLNSNGDIKTNGNLYLGNKSKTDILNISNPTTGELVNDTTDNTLVIYENDGWYPVQLGTKLSK